MTIFLILFSFSSTAAAFILSFLFGSLTPLIAAISLALGYVFAQTQAVDLLADAPDFRLKTCFPGAGGSLDIALICIVLLFTARHFLWMLFPTDHNWATLSLTNFGDLPLHINYIRTLTTVPQFPPLNPSFSSESLLYPFGPDLFNALWEILGIKMTAHLFFVGLTATIVSVICLRVYAGWWGVGAFFLSGGFAGWQVLSGSPLVNFQEAVDWKNLFLAVFITQRGMLFALPAGLLLLHLVRRHFKQKLSNRSLLTLGFIWGILPLFHLHAFVIISIMLFGLILIDGGWRAAYRFTFSPLLAVALLPATFFVLRSSRGFQSAGVMHFDWAWTSTPEKIFPFLWLNFGLWLLVPFVLAACIFWFTPQAKRRRLLAELLFYVGLFVIFFNVMLAPWAWDNIKLLIWPYLGLVSLCSRVINPLFDRSWQGTQLTWLRWGVAACLFSSGFVSLIWSIQSPAMRSVVIYSMDSLASTEGALAEVPPNAVFAAATSHNHSLTYFGRLRAVGYAGHLWSHGIKSDTQTLRLNSLMAGEGEWKSLASELGVTHIFWGPAERGQYGEGERPWMKAAENVSRVPGYEIYSLTSMKDNK